MSQQKAIRVFHCADLHLDSPFSSMGVDRSEAAGRLLRGVFTSMMLYVRSEHYDLVLMPGDLFDDGYASESTADLMISEFAKASDCRFVIAPGNHDPFVPGGVYAAKTFPPNVFIFRESRLSCFSFDDLGVDVYGWAFTSPSFDENPLAGMRVRDPARINLLCAHCEVGKPISRYCPVSEGDLAAFGACYAALGHIHHRSGVMPVGNGFYAYSGCPSGRSFDETGIGGAYLVEIEPETHAVQARFRPFAQCHYEIETLDVTGAQSRDAVLSAIRTCIAQKRYDAQTALRIVLEGAVGDFEMDTAGMENEIDRLFYLQILDHTMPHFDSDYLAHDFTVRGEFYRCLLPQLEQGSPEERRIAAAALRYGMAALSGAPLTEEK